MRITEDQITQSPSGLQLVQLALGHPESHGLAHLGESERTGDLRGDRWDETTDEKIIGGTWVLNQFMIQLDWWYMDWFFRKNLHRKHPETMALPIKGIKITAWKFMNMNYTMGGNWSKQLPVILFSPSRIAGDLTWCDRNALVSRGRKIERTVHS